MKTEGSLPCSQEPATGPSPEADFFVNCTKDQISQVAALIHAVTLTVMW